MTLINKLIYNVIKWGGYYNFRKSVTNGVSRWQYLKFKMSRDKRVYWPVHKNSEVTHPDRIFVGINSNPATRPGCYLQGNGTIYIGDYVHFASNIGIISGNHGLYDHYKHECAPVVINDYSWIGMGAIILPGVTLGERTVVGAGSVVTKSFPDGYCVIAGNPARMIKKLEPQKFKKYIFETEYYGFVPKAKFKKFAEKYLNKNIFLKDILSEVHS